MSIQLPRVHILTSPARQGLCAQTSRRWSGTDWPAPLHVHTDSDVQEPTQIWYNHTRVRLLKDPFIRMLYDALKEPGGEADWLLLLGDNLDFHPRLAAFVREWPVMEDLDCLFASLFNPALSQPASAIPESRALAAEPGLFRASQALLLRRWAAQAALTAWDTVSGTPGQRLALLFGRGHAIWMHQPSLVQQLQDNFDEQAQEPQALDFDATWEPPGSSYAPKPVVFIAKEYSGQPLG